MRRFATMQGKKKKLRLLFLASLPLLVKSCPGEKKIFCPKRCSEKCGREREKCFRQKFKAELTYDSRKKGTDFAEFLHKVLVDTWTTWKISSISVQIVRKSRCYLIFSPHELFYFQILQMIWLWKICSSYGPLKEDDRILWEDFWLRGTKREWWYFEIWVVKGNFHLATLKCDAKPPIIQIKFSGG